jgi:hypothetical protein
MRKAEHVAPVGGHEDCLESISLKTLSDNIKCYSGHRRVWKVNFTMDL